MINIITKYLSQILEVIHATGIYAYRGQQDSRWVLHSAATRRLIREHGSDIVMDPEFAQLYINYHLDTLIEPARGKEKVTVPFSVQYVTSIKKIDGTESVCIYQI